MEEKKIEDLVYNKPEQDKSLESLIIQSDAVFDETASKRKQLEDKLTKIIDAITISDDDNDKIIAAKTSLLKAYDDILSSREKAFEKRITIRQKQKVTDTASQLADVVTETLNKIGFNEEYVPSSKVALTESEKAAIDSRLSKLDEISIDSITDGETQKSVKK